MQIILTYTLLSCPFLHRSIIFKIGHDFLDTQYGNQVKVVVLSPNILQTMAEGTETGIVEIKTWTFQPAGVNLVSPKFVNPK